MNTLRPDFLTAADGTFTEFAVLQEAPESHPVLRPHRIAIGLYDRGPGGLARRRRVELDVTGERTAVPELAGERRPDLVLINDDDLTFAKIRLDEHSMRTLIASIGEFAESLPGRALLGRGVGHVPGRRACCQGLPGARAVGPAVDHRDQHAPDAPAPGCRRRPTVRRPALAGHRPGRARRRTARAALRGGVRL